MTKNIAWCITGGGQYLAESIEQVSIAKSSSAARVCSFVSSAGEEVLMMYGLLDRVTQISPGGYMEEVFLERLSGKSFSKTGRLMLGRFDRLLVAPATSNTVAKVVAGIADSMVSNASALANKSGVPVFVLPTEIRANARSVTPYSIDRESCSGCSDCPPRLACPSGALSDQIDLMRCSGCGKCVDLCKNGAISAAAISASVRKIDRKNINRLARMPGIFVLNCPEEIGSAFL